MSYRIVRIGPSGGISLWTARSDDPGGWPPCPDDFYSAREAEAWIAGFSARDRDLPNGADKRDWPNVMERVAFSKGWEFCDRDIRDDDAIMGEETALQVHLLSAHQMCMRATYPWYRMIQYTNELLERSGCVIYIVDLDGTVHREMNPPPEAREHLNYCYEQIARVEADYCWAVMEAVRLFT